MVVGDPAAGLLPGDWEMTGIDEAIRVALADAAD